MKFSYKGEKIRRLREDALYSRDLLARMARTTYWIVGRVENQFYKSIDARLIEDLAAALGVHPNAISDDYYPPTLPYIQRVRYNPELLKARRKELRLTLEQVGDRAGVSLEAVAKLEGKDTAKPETVRRVCQALGLNPRDVSPAFKIIPGIGERELYMEALGQGAFGYPETESI